MRLAVVGKNKYSCIEVPVLQMVRGIASNHRFYGSVESFYLTIRLWIIDCREESAHVEDITDALKQLRCEPFAIVGKQIFAWQ